MPQLLLHGFPEGAIRINSVVSYLCKDGKVTWFVGDDNYFSHSVSEKRAYRYAVSILLANGYARAVDFQNSQLAIAHRTLMRWCALLESKGAAAFFTPPGVRGGTVFTDDKIKECESYLWANETIASAARKAKVDDSALRKAVSSGRVRKEPPLALVGQAGVERDGSIKSERTQQDAQAADGIGNACTRADERMMAAVGLIESASTRFEHAFDVSNGGLLCGLPLLTANGLFSGLDRYLTLPQGFYTAMHILTLLGYMALARIKRPEGLRHIAPGEMGKVIGLDRAPEVRTLRHKVHWMAENGQPHEWAKELSKSWMDDDPEMAGYLYVDGHVRVYHGSGVKLPKRYVSRQKLCMRGVTDYWVNDAIGRPFFVVSQELNESFSEVLIKDIVPRLLESVPNQPSEEQLASDPLLHRFVMVFDREGYSVPLFQKLWENRIGVITYRKFVKEQWPLSEFKGLEVPGSHGESSIMQIASREITLQSGGASVDALEVRRLTETGHQTAVISTAKRLVTDRIAGGMFTRWCQENFFKYMMQHFDIDGLTQYGAEDISGTFSVISPKWRNLDKEKASCQRKLRRIKAKLGKKALQNEDQSIKEHAELIEQAQILEEELKQIKAELKTTPKRIEIGELPEEERPKRLKPMSKTLTDTVKMIAYRAETAMVEMLKGYLTKKEEARALIRELFVSDADLVPNQSENILTVKVHRMTQPVNDQAIKKLLDELNQTEFHHPETGMKIVYQMA